MKPKVMILINNLLHGGAERMVFDIADKIDKSKFDLRVVYMKDHKYFKGGNKTFLEDIEKLGVKVTCLGGKNKSAVRESIALWKLLRTEKPDMLHTFLPYAGTIGRVVGRLTGIKTIISVQCNLKMASSGKVYFLDKLTLPLATVWTAAARAIEEEYSIDSQAFSDELWNKGRRHFTVVSGVDIEDIEKVVHSTNKIEKKKSIGIQEGNKVVAMTARLISWKGHEDLIRAFALLSHNTELLLIGGGPKLEEFQAIAREQGVFERVHFLGNRADLFELMAITDVYVQSYARASDGSIWKGPNTSQMVAAGAGVPAVSTEVPLIETFMQDDITGKIAQVNDPKDLAVQINYLLQNEEKAKEMAANALAMVKEKYSLYAMVKAYENIYEKTF